MNKVDSMIADHVADAMAIERLAHLLYTRASGGDWVIKWKCLDPKLKKIWLIKAKRDVLNWLNAEQGTDYQLED